MLIISFTCSSFAWGQHHQHGDTSLKKEVSKVVKATEKNLEVSPDFCPEPGDRAYVNFDPQHLKDPKGFHGMLFFGSEETFYISHLPMFHKPHDYQAIVEVKLPADAKAKYQAALKKSGGYFTWAPAENWVLPEVITKKAPIRGSLVQGHFERGGSPLLDVELELVRVVFYKKISEKDKKPEKEKYIVFGKGKEYFMAHEVFERPNVDELIPLPQDKKFSDALKGDIKDNGLTYLDSLEVKDKKVIMKKGKEEVEFPYQEFYRETGDLQ